jgi:hypothetical protein
MVRGAVGRPVRHPSLGAHLETCWDMQLELLLGLEDEKRRPGTTVILADIAEELVRRVLADHPDEKAISLLAISVSR